jgi:hypothetical protein
VQGDPSRPSLDTVHTVEIGNGGKTPIVIKNSGSEDLPHKGIYSELSHKGIYSELSHKGIYSELSHKGIYSELSHKGIYSELSRF